MINFNLLFNAVFFGAIGLGIFFGFIRGFKKSLYSLAVMIIFYTVFFLTINMAVKALWTLPIPVGSLLSSYIPELAGANSFREALPILIQKYATEFIGTNVTNDALNAFMTSMSVFVLKIIYTIVYFSVFYLLYRFIFWIIRLIFFRGRDKEAPKHHSIGLVVGILHGILTAYVILIFAGGIMSITESALSIAPSDYKIPEARNAVDAFRANLFVKTAQSFGIKTANTPKADSVDHYLFDKVLSTSYGGQEISFRKELSIAANINTIYQNSKFKQTDNISDLTGDEVRSVFELLSESNLVTSMLPAAIETGVQYYNSQTDAANRITIPIEDLNQIDWPNELKQLGEISGDTIDIINAAGIANPDANLTTVTLNGNDIKALFDALSQSKVVNIAAYDALEPLLETYAGSLSAVITVPSGINWPDEIQAIGSIAGEIADTGITVGDIESGNPSVILNAVSNIDFTTLLNSKIASQALINIISGKSGLEGMNVFVVPKNVVWITYGSDGKPDGGELKNILLAINSVAKDAANVDFSNLTFNDVADLSDDSINAIFNSEVFVATVSSLITDMDLGNTPLVIPDSVYDSNHYITKTELTALAESAKMVVTALACDEGVSCDSGFDLSKAFTLSDTDVNTLLNSNIIAATVGNVIIDQGSGVLSIPDSALTTITVNSVSKNVVSKDEIRKLFTAASALGITDIQNTTFDASLLKNLATPTDTTVLDQNKADEVLASDIIHATLSKMLLDLASGTDAVLTVPYVDVNGTAVRYTQGNTEYISDTELEAVLQAVLKLDITNFDTVNSLDVSTISDNISTLLNSAILHATVSKQLLDLGNPVVVPYYDENDNPIRITEGPVGEQTDYVSKTEIEAIVNVLDVLGITDINSFNGTVDISKFYDAANQNILLSSATLQATVSKMMFDLGNNVLSIPYEDVNGNVIRKTVGTGSEATQYVVKDEIMHMIDALQVLGITDMNQFDGNVDISKFYDSNNQDIMLASASIHATISRILFGLGNNVLTIPNTDVDGNVIRITAGTGTQATEYVAKGEIEALIDNMKVLGITDLNNFSGTVDISKFYDPANQDILLSSASLQATISKTMLDLGSNILTVPFTAEDGTVIRETVGGTEFVSKDEIKHLIDALQLLNITDINHFDGAVNLTQFFNNTTNQETLLASASLHATISKMMLDLGSGVLTVPYYDVDNNPIRVTQGATEYVVKPEIEALINGLDLLGITDINHFNGTVALTNIIDNPTNEETLLASASLHATISRIMLNLDSSGTLIVPMTDENNVPIRTATGAGTEATPYVSKAEVTATIDALGILGINDINNFSGTVTLTNLINNTANQEKLLASASIQATISHQMFNLGSAVLDVPATDIDGNSVHQVVSGTDFVTKTEIENLINALGVLGINDVTSFTGAFNLSSLATDASQNTLLASASLHATISQKLLDLNDDVLMVPLESASGASIQDNVNSTDFIVKPEIKAIINAFLAMNYTNLDSFGTQINLGEFFNNSAVLLASSSIQATLSARLLNLGDNLLVPDTYQNGNPIRITVAGTEYIDNSELNAILTALHELNLTDFSSVNMNPANVFNVDFNTLLSSASIQATISKNILSSALDETTAVPGSLSLVVPTYFRQDITVAGAPKEQIESTELYNLLTALKTLNITNFGDAMNASAITSMNGADLDTILLSGSIHVTMDNMLKGNTNIVIPDLAKGDYYGLTGITTPAELKAFIQAADVFSLNFTSVSFDVNAVKGLTAAQQDVVLNSMIVRNTLTIQIGTMTNLNLIPDTYFENNDRTTFLTKDGILYAMSLI